MSKRFLTSTLAVLALAACASTPLQPPATKVARHAAPATTPGKAPPVIDVAEAWVSPETPAEELDSIATWTTPEGATWLLATGKSSHRLSVYDGATGRLLGTHGQRGSAPGQFDRPNGIAVFGDHVFVVERDNQRVQVLTLPDFEPLGSFGHGILRSPYGIWLNETEPGELEAYVTDSFMYGKHFDVLPPLAEMDQRVRRFRVQFDQDGGLRSNYGGAFGDTHAATALHAVESIAGDLANDRLMIADEWMSPKDHIVSTLRAYSFDGRYTGHSLPQDSFAAQAEGVALWTCPDGGGYWIAVDQLAPLTIFHLFDRLTLEPRGSFQGRVTAHTDGVALHAIATARFPGGALYAVHDDKAVAAFDLRDVADALDLAPDCVR